MCRIPRLGRLVCASALTLTALSISGRATAQGTTRAESEAERGLRRWGLGVDAGIGIANFLDGDTASVTSPGPTWAARAILGTRRALALEAGYIGETHGVNTLGLQDTAIIVGSGLEAAARFAFANAGFGKEKAWNLKPYWLLGLAWKHYSLTNTSFNTSNVSKSDDIAEIPMGIGLAWRYQHLLLDQRFVLRPAFGSDLFRSPTGGNDQPLGTWSLLARAGLEF